MSPRNDVSPSDIMPLRDPDTGKIDPYSNSVIVEDYDASRRQTGMASMTTTAFTEELFSLMYDALEEFVKAENQMRELIGEIGDERPMDPHDRAYEKAVLALSKAKGGE